MAAVKVFVRVSGQAEIDIGTARSIADVPVLLSLLSDYLISGMRPDEYENESAIGIRSSSGSLSSTPCCGPS